MVYLAFGSQAGVGKDSAADYLIRTYGGKKMAFAFPLHKIQTYVQQELGFKVQKDRAFLQLLGDWAKSVNPTVFVDNLLQKVSEEKDNMLVTDVRYEAEFNALKKEGFILVKIDRKNREVFLDNKVGLHSSETSLEDAPWDYVVSNNGTLEELYPKLDRIYLLTGGLPVFR